MLITGIELRNFRYIEHEKLTPPIGKTFILLGQNGAGKSSFIWGVPFCFYGYSDWNLKDTLKWGKTKGYVRVFFENREIKYQATRFFDKRSSSFELRQLIDGEYKKIGGGLNQEAEAEFAKIFPVPKEAFLQIVTKVQTDNSDYALGSFCNATPKGMYDIIKRFVEVVKFEKYSKHNDKIIENLKESLVEYRTIAENSRKTIENLELKPIKETELRKIETKIENARDTMNSIKKKLDYAKKYFEKLEEYKDAQKIIKKYDGIKEWYDKWQPLKVLKKPDQKYDEKLLEELEQQIESDRKILEEIPEKIEQAEKTIEEKEKLLEEKTNEKMELIKKNDDIYQQIAEKEKQIKLLEKGKCPECERYFKNTEDRIENEKEKIADLKEKLIKEELLEELSTSISNYRSDISQSRIAIKTFNNKNLSITSSISSKEKKITKIKEAKKQTEDWKRRTKFIEKYNEKFPFKKSPDEAYRLYTNVLDVKPPEGEQPRPIEVLNRLYEEKEENYLSLKSEHKNLQNTKKQYEYHIKQIEEAIEEIGDLEKDYEKHKQLKILYSRNGAPHFMVKEYLDHLQYNANRYLERFTGGRFSIEFKTNHNSKSKPIELIFYDANRNNKPRPYSTFSCGEKTRVALSVEIFAMSKTFTQLTNIEIKTTLIDEVYGLDEKGQKEYAKILMEMSGVRPIMGGVVCFESMANNFENIIKIEDGKIVN